MASPNRIQNKRIGIDVKELFNTRELSKQEIEEKYPKKKLQQRFGRKGYREKTKNLASKYYIIVNVFNNNLPKNFDEISKSDIEEIIKEFLSEQGEKQLRNEIRKAFKANLTEEQIDYIQKLKLLIEEEKDPEYIQRYEDEIREFTDLNKDEEEYFKELIETTIFLLKGIITPGLSEEERKKRRKDYEKVKARYLPKPLKEKEKEQYPPVGPAPIKGKGLKKTKIEHALTQFLVRKDRESREELINLMIDSKQEQSLYDTIEVREGKTNVYLDNEGNKRSFYPTLYDAFIKLNGTPTYEDVTVKVNGKKKKVNIISKWKFPITNNIVSILKNLIFIELEKQLETKQLKREAEIQAQRRNEIFEAGKSSNETLIEEAEALIKKSRAENLLSDELANLVSETDRKKSKEKAAWSKAIENERERLREKKEEDDEEKKYERKEEEELEIEEGLNEEEEENEEEVEIGLEIESAVEASTSVDLIEEKVVTKGKNGKVKEKTEKFYVIRSKLIGFADKLKALGGTYQKGKQRWIFSATKMFERTDKKKKYKRNEPVEGKYVDAKKIKEKIEHVVQQYYKREILDNANKEKLVKDVERRLEGKEILSRQYRYEDEYKYNLKNKRNTELTVFKDIKNLLENVQRSVKERSGHELISKQLRNPLFGLYDRRLQRKLKSRNPLLHITKRQERNQRNEFINIKYNRSQVKELISSPDILANMLLGQDDGIDELLRVVLTLYMNRILKNNVMIIELLKNLNVENTTDYIENLSNQILNNFFTFYTSGFSESIEDIVKSLITPFIILDNTNDMGKRANIFRNRLIQNYYIDIVTLTIEEMFPEVFNNPHISTKDQSIIKNYINIYIEETTNKLINDVFRSLYSRKVLYKEDQNIYEVPEQLLELPLTSEKIFHDYDFCQDTWNLFGENSSEDTIIYYDTEDNKNYCFSIDELLDLKSPYVNEYTGRQFDKKFIINIQSKYNLGNERKDKNNSYQKEEKREKKEEKKICETCEKLVDDEDSFRTIIYDLYVSGKLMGNTVYYCSRNGCLQNSKIPEQVKLKKKVKFSS